MASRVRLLTDGDIGSRTSGEGKGNSSLVMWMKVIELDIPRHLGGSSHRLCCFFLIAVTVRPLCSSVVTNSIVGRQSVLQKSTA
jgi:hypothetical protein